MKSQPQVLSVSEGKSMIYLIPGIFLIVVAIAFFYFLPILSIILLASAIILFLAETGLEIDVEQMRYRRYKSLFGTKFGLWKIMLNVVEFHITLAVESKTYRTIPYQTNAAWSSRSSTSRSISYDLSYVDELNLNTIVFEFQEYKLCTAIAKQLRQYSNYEVIDHVAIKLEENRQKRMNRR